MLIVGADWLVEAAVAFARAFGVSDLVVGLTVVAVGTSMPEIATSIVAAMRGQRDIAVGNVVGSNIFNILAVLGASGIASGTGLPVSEAARNFDLWVMLAVAFACLPIMITGREIARWEGSVFLAYYAAYTAWLVLRAQQHQPAGLLGDHAGLRDAAHGDHRRGRHRAQQRQARIGGGDRAACLACRADPGDENRRQPGPDVGVAPAENRRRPGPDVGATPVAIPDRDARGGNRPLESTPACRFGIIRFFPRSAAGAGRIRCCQAPGSDPALRRVSIQRRSPADRLQPCRVRDVG